MKKKIVGICLVASTFLYSAGIPVVDMTSLAQQIATWAKEAKRWTDTVNFYKDQLEGLEDQLLAQTEIRDTVQFIKDLRALSEFVHGVSNDFLSLNDGLSAGAQALFDKYNLYKECENDWFNEDEKRICENKMIRRVNEIAAYQKYKDDLTDSYNELSVLAAKLAASEDLKESQDIGNAINLTIAQLNIKKSQIELVNAQNEQLRHIDKEQRRQLYIKKLRKKDDRDYSEW